MGTKTKNYVFVYGTLKRGYYNNYLLERSRFIGRSVTCRPLCMYSYGVPTVGIPTTKAMQKVALPIIGETYCVSNIVFAILDSLEGYPRMYNRVLEEVKTENKIILAHIYITGRTELRHPRLLKRILCDRRGQADGTIVVKDDKYEWVGSRYDRVRRSVHNYG